MPDTSQIITEAERPIFRESFGGEGFQIGGWAESVQECRVLNESARMGFLRLAGGVIYSTSLTKQTDCLVD